MVSKADVKSFMKKLAAYKETPKGKAVFKKKEAHQKKMMGKQAMSFDSAGKMTGIHHAKAAKKKRG